MTPSKPAVVVVAAAAAALAAIAACSPPPKTTAAHVVNLPAITPTAATSASAPPAPPPPAPRQLDREKLALAEQTVERAFQAADEAERRAAFDAALTAYEEATGEKAQAVALRALRIVMVSESSAVVGGVLEPDESSYAVAVRLEPPGKNKARPRGRPFRLFGSGAHVPDVSVGQGGRFVINDDGAGAFYSTLSGEGRALPAGHRYDVARGGVVISSERAVELVDAATGGPLLEKTSVAISEEALNAAALLADGRYWVASPPFGEPGGAVVIDTDERRVTVNAAPAAACAVDADGRQLLLLRTPADSAQSATLEFVPFDGGPPTKITLGKQGAAERPTVSVLKRRRGAIAALAKDIILDLDAHKVVDVAPREPRVGPPGLAAVPVGSAGSGKSAVAPLAGLARPPRRAVKPYYIKEQAWAENGLKSFDGKTAALYTEIPGKEDSPLELVIASTEPLRARHRIEISPGSTWRTAYFLDNRFLVAQQYPQFDVYDVTTGSLVAAPAFDDCSGALPVFGHYIVCGSALWDLTGGPGLDGVEGLVDLGASRELWWKGKNGLRALDVRRGDPGELRFLASGSVVVRDLAVPSWLHCRFGEQLAPFEVCRRIALDPSSAPL